MASEGTRPRGLGQGLSLLLGDAPVRSTLAEGIHALPIDDVRPNPRQPRARLDEAAFTELVESVRRDGIVQPIVVRPVEGGYELIAGERRWRAASAAGLTTVPAVVRVADDQQSLALALVENVVRSDLNAVELARAYARLVDEFGLSQAQVAEVVGRSRVSVANALRLLDLPDDVLARVGRGELSEGHGRAILQAPDQDSRRQLSQLAVSRSLSVRQTEARARALARGRSAPHRARRGPAWYDIDLANDVVDAVYRLVGLPARVTSDGDACRVEIRARSADELAALAQRLEAAAAAVPADHGPAVS